MIAHYRKSRDKSYGIVAGEILKLLRVRLRSHCGEKREIGKIFLICDVSYYGRNALQGLIFCGGIISGRKKFCVGMHFQRRNHLWTEEMLCRDYFLVEESSLSGRNALQGLFSSGGIIPERKKCFADNMK